MRIIVMKLVSKDYRVLIGGGGGDREDASCFRDAVKVSFITGPVFACLSSGSRSAAAAVGSEARLPVSYDDFLEVSSLAVLLHAFMHVCWSSRLYMCIMMMLLLCVYYYDDDAVDACAGVEELVPGTVALRIAEALLSVEMTR